MHDKEHVVFNTAFIKVIDKVYSKENLTAYVEQMHLNNLFPSFKEEITNGKISFKVENTLFYKNGSGVFSKFIQFIYQRVYKDGFFFIRLFRKIDPKEDVLFITHMHPITFFFFKLIKIFFPKIKVLIVLHGDADSVLTRNKHNLPVSFWGIIYMLGFKIKQANCYYILLSKLGLKLLSEKKILLKKEMLDIPHPYFYTNRTPASIDLKQKINIGYIGSLTNRKNGQLFIDIANKIKQSSAAEHYIFSQIGSIDQNFLLLLNENIKVVKKENGYIDRNLFQIKIAEIDYAIFLFPNDEFRIRVSGAFYDAVEFCKPLIVLKSDYFDSIFEEAGNIGYVCNSTSNIVDLLQYLIEYPAIRKEQYMQQCENLSKYRDKLSISNVKRRLIGELEAKNLL
ncbi:MAG: glycosyltransferase [Arachidicoccus sp.]|nr:glycosyltransferase [Arachidicoccus sp.]